MKAQHFARNILAAAVLSALGAHAAVAADFSEGVYENHGEQDVYDNFIRPNLWRQRFPRWKAATFVYGQDGQRRFL